MKKRKTVVPVVVKSKVTKRPHLKIMAKLKEKIAARLREQIGEELGNDIMTALEDKTIEQ